MAAVSVRYIVNDIDAAIDFYTKHLGFEVDLHPAPEFAILSRGDLRLMLNRPNGPGGASQPMPDGRKPQPGGWNRIQLEIHDLAGEVETLRSAGAHFRSEIISGMGGKQILLDDPAGNPIELFEARRGMMLIIHFFVRFGEIGDRLARPVGAANAPSPRTRSVLRTKCELSPNRIAKGVSGNAS
jgi:catechol 2,3-dioxygenase-like lactoylglutathione lyase family enzyme